MRENRTAQINSLSASEGVFTTAQAERLGVSRGTLAKACAAGRLRRIAHGAYRSAATTPSQDDEVAAAWKLTAPGKFLHERMMRADWDGVVVGGTTAASLDGIGDFYATPIRMYAPKRIKTRNSDISISVREIAWDDVSFDHGFAVTRMERTLVDLVLDDEDLSLVFDAYEDARSRRFDHARLRQIVSGLPLRMKSKVINGLDEMGATWRTG